MQRRCEGYEYIGVFLWRWVCGGEDHLELEGEKATCPMPSNTLIFEMS